jgi:hypothetical protein
MDVDVHHPPPLPLIDLVRGTVRASDPGVVHQDVDTLVLLVFMVDLRYGWRIIPSPDAR